MPPFCSCQALYRLGRHAESAEVYASITENEEEEGRAAGGFPPVSVNLAAAYAAAGSGERALEAFPVEDVSGSVPTVAPGLETRHLSSRNVCLSSRILSCSN